MIVIGTDVVERYFAASEGHKGISVAKSQHAAWLAIAESALWKKPADVKAAHPKASILKNGRVVFNIKGNDFRLVTWISYQAEVVVIRFFGSHRDYDDIDAGLI